jgi:hypothetical protein
MRKSHAVRMVLLLLCTVLHLHAGTPTFEGLWKTNHGPLRLMVEGDQVKGCYRSKGLAFIEGTVTGDTLRFTYRLPNGGKGEGTWQLDEKGQAFQGSWKSQDGAKSGAWNGSIQPRTKGRSWLVILEAHWEKNLQEPEYAYGDMLRQFFARVPEVQVRHRFFDGHADFARWCAELPFFNETVVLYVSSHGTEKGITVNRRVMDGAFVGEQLRYAPEVKLVHLGACLTMSGTMPQKIREVSGRDLPVSGFTLEADWAGSAVVDFAYLDLVLSRRMKPAEAVRQMTNHVTFAREKVPSDCRIPAMGLKIVE